MLGTAQTWKNAGRARAVCTLSPQIIKAHLTCTAIWTRPEGDGLWSRRDWTARSIFTAAGLITKMALGTWTANFGSGWTKSSVWRTPVDAEFTWTSRKQTETRCMRSTTTLLWRAKGATISWVWEPIQVRAEVVKAENHVRVICSLRSWWSSWSREFILILIFIIIMILFNQMTSRYKRYYYYYHNDDDDIFQSSDKQT